jgi:hypothetical protein
MNPALVSRAFLFFAYPMQITGDKVWVAVDGLTSATPLARLAASQPDQALADLPVTWNQAFFGIIPGSMGETSTLACLLGAGLLLYTGHRLLAGDARHAPGRNGCGPAFTWSLIRRTPVRHRAAMAPGARRFRLRPGIHGHRSGFRRPDPHWANGSTDSSSACCALSSGSPTPPFPKG